MLNRVMVSLWRRKIIGSMFDQIQASQFTIGHLKFFLEAADWKEKISFTTTSTSKHVKVRHQGSEYHQGVDQCPRSG